MKTTTSLTALALAGATALALAVPTLAPRLADQLSPASSVTSGSTAPWTNDGSWSGGSSSTTTDPATGGTGTTTSASQTAAVTAAQSKGIVLITTQTTSGQAAGTGMVLTADGQILTNYHVVEGSTSIEVEIVDTAKTYTATVVGHDATRDVALLQLKNASGLATITPDDDQVALGQELTAVGNASGGGELVAATGSVTGLEKQVTVSSETGGTETLTGVIETNAGAVAGDSGGPMFDAEGEVLGMTTAGSSRVTASPRGGRSTQDSTSTTVSYAVPIDDALAVIEQIRTGKESGTVEVGAKAYLGISVAGSSSLVVASVVTDGPAAVAGLTAGSTITAINGVTVSSHDDLSAQLATLDPGAKVKLTWKDSSGTAHSATVTLGTSPIN
jgi:S1-C subfamily serine protease